MKNLPECEQVLKRPCKRVCGKAALYSKCTESLHRLLGHKCRTISEEVQLIVDGIQLEHKPVLVYYASITIQLVHTRGSYFILLADRHCEVVKHSSYPTLVRTMENLRSAYERYFGLKYQEVRVAVPADSDAPGVAVERETLVWTFGKSFVTDGAEFYYRTQVEWVGEAEGGGAEGEGSSEIMVASLLGGGGGLHAKEGAPGVRGGGSSRAGGRLSCKRRSSLSPEKKADEEGPAEMSQQEDATPHDEIHRSASEEDASAQQETSQQAHGSPKKEESGTFSMFFGKPPPQWNSQHSDEDSACGRASLQDSHSERDSSREQGLSTENCASSPGHCNSPAAEQDALHSTSAQTPPGSAGRSLLPCYSGVRSYDAVNGRGSATQSACSTSSSVYSVLQRRSARGSAVQGATGIHLSQAYAEYCEGTPPGDEMSLQARGGYSGSPLAASLPQDAAASQCYTRSASIRVFPENTQCTQRHTETAGAQQGTNAGAQQSPFHRGSGYPVTSSYQVRGAHPQSMTETGAVNAKLRKFPAVQQDAINEEPPLHPDAPLPSSVHAVRQSHILHLSRPIVRQKRVPNAHSVQAAMSEPLPFKKPAMAVGRAAELMAMISGEKGIRNGEKMSQAVGNEEDFESQAGMPDIF